jgi:hypothetical protein
VSNRLKIHKSHTPDDALFFDLHKINHDILIKELPRRFAPVPIDPEVVKNIWRQRIEAASKPPSSNNLRSSGTLAAPVEATYPEEEKVASDTGSVS